MGGGEDAQLNVIHRNDLTVEDNPVPVVRIIPHNGGDPRPERGGKGRSKPPPSSAQQQLFFPFFLS